MCVIWFTLQSTVILIRVFLVFNSVLYFSLFAYSLPSLRPLLDVNYLPLADMRIARTFCFTHRGQALYLSSPTEIQRITYSQEMCDNLQVSTAAIYLSILYFTYTVYQSLYPSLVVTCNILDFCF